MKDLAILTRLGLPRLNTYYFQRRNQIIGQIGSPAFPGAAVASTLNRTLFEFKATTRYECDERERTLAKAGLLLREAKETGNYRELMTLDVTDPRHPYYHEHPWQSALKMDTFDLTPYQQYLRWHAITWRACHEWDLMGLMLDDLMTPQSHDSDPFLEEAIRRLPYAQRTERERRLMRAYDMMIRREELDEPDWTHPEDDVAYLIPYYNMVVDEHREQRDNAVDLRAR
eukprot:NODE_3819_length_911_cov_31.309745_g3513_i0.p1 GENE.NODE_3819_length_911_cov_31.309745_g3513_i0~~NODE_3819_length_911_cov_31.309745_g3513_i0.p1  ORF type:complete len:236 (+),score=60.15 NODE_3819_length_911_cov_31.309745_g3513_i0:26-709(+)